MLLLCDYLTSPSAVSGLYFFCITLKAKYLISDLLLLKGKELANTRGFIINKNINTRILIYLYFSEITLLQKIKHDGWQVFKVTQKFKVQKYQTTPFILSQIL